MYVYTYNAWISYFFLYWILYSSVLIGLIYIQFRIPIYPITFMHGIVWWMRWKNVKRITKSQRKKIKNKPEWSDGKYSYTAGERSRIETRKTIFILNEIIRISCSILYSTKLNENTNWLLAHMSHHFEFILFRFFSCAVLLSSGYIGLYMLAFNGIRYPRLCVSVCLPDEHLIY